jgi:hypothetical protein
VAEAPEEGDGVAEAEAPAPKAPGPTAATPSNIAADRAAADAEAARAARLEAQREQAEAEKRRKEADALAKSQKIKEDAARREAAEALKKAAAVALTAAAEEKARLDGEAALAQQKAADMERERKAADAAAESQRQAELAAQQKAAAEQARQQQAEQARIAAEAAEREEKARIAKLQEAEIKAQQEKAAEAKRQAEAAAAAEAAAKAPAPAPAPGTPAVAAVPDGECDPAKLETNALTGRLTDPTIQCLETRLVNAPKMTDKKKISGVLMTDAWAKGDKERWESLIKRHLDEIDQSDPDLCYKYALHLSRQGPGRASGVIRWANVALENRTVWIGDTYTSRVYSLYKVRAAASQALWQQAETEHSTAPSDETREKVEKYRNMTKVNAREWFDYARDSGKEATTALQLCESAAGTKDYCVAT